MMDGSGMTNAINQVNAAKLLQPTQLGTTGSAGPDSAGGKEFKQLLMDSLQQVNQLQQEADAKVENLATGKSDNVVEVFSAVRKADVAFSLLMEIRNKMLDAYQEIQQMRI
jgi:flagellar hook-basal body complex protein FliE